jgi:hypothetical protein
MPSLTQLTSNHLVILARALMSAMGGKQTLPDQMTWAATTWIELLP